MATGKTVTFGRSLGDARIQRHDLCRRALPGFDPGFLFAGDGVEPPAGDLGLARQRLRLGA